MFEGTTVLGHDDEVARCVRGAAPGALGLPPGTSFTSGPPLRRAPPPPSPVPSPARRTAAWTSAASSAGISAIGVSYRTGRGSRPGAQVRIAQVGQQATSSANRRRASVLPSRSTLTGASPWSLRRPPRPMRFSTSKRPYPGHVLSSLRPSLCVVRGPIAGQRGDLGRRCVGAQRRQGNE